MVDDLPGIQRFEIELDRALESLSSLSVDGSEALRLALNFIDFAHYDLNEPLAGQFSRGLDILAPFFIAGKQGQQPDIQQLASDLNFAGHYYLLRDYLYYTYNGTC
jgi:hypothetical protein